MSVNQYRSISEAIDHLRNRGYTANFEVTEGRLRAADSGRTLRAEDVRVVEHHRFEGESNPDDMSVVYAIESVQGDRGVLVDAYGPYANPAVGELLSHATIDEDVQ